MARVALVTGANRGLGFETCRQLGRAGMTIVATSRDTGDGLRAVDALRLEKIDATHETLDVGDEASIGSLAERWRGKALDVLVNNAGISMRGFDAHVAEQTTRVNFGGAMRVTDALLPAMRDGSRIVMVSSVMGEISGVSADVGKRFMDPGLDRAGLVALVAEFVRDVSEGHHTERGWPTSAYRVSKIALNALTRILAHELAPRKILVNAVCPGWVKTAMGGPSASRSVDVGAKSIVWGALIPDGGPSGGFFRDGKRVGW